MEKYGKSFSVQKNKNLVHIGYKTDCVVHEYSYWDRKNLKFSQIFANTIAEQQIKK